MDKELIKKTLHRYYDLIAGGVCLIRQTAEEQILFVNEEMLRIYQCATEDEFFQLTKGRFAGLMEAEDYVPLEARTNSRHGDLDEGYSFLTFRCYTKTGSYRHIEGTFHKVDSPEFGKVWVLDLVNKERNLAVSNLDPPQHAPLLPARAADGGRPAQDRRARHLRGALLPGLSEPDEFQGLQ